jgi:UDP-GlcNAc:undecaprenyl-phosphate GlcNAc-1-phosphate transferase
MSPSLLPALTAFGIAAAVTAVVTPAVRYIAMRFGYYAVPVRDRWHLKPVPLLGGLAIVAGVGAGLGMVDDWSPLVPLVLCSGLMALLGIVDDFWKLRPSMKLIVQMLIAGLFLVLVPPPSFTGSVVVNQLLAFTWIVGITNAFNLLDNMDGLSAGVATIAGGGYLGLLLSGSGSPLTVPIAAFVGAAAGFLVYNFSPASIFMGDGGSFFLGSFLGAAGLMLASSMESRPVHAALVPMLILLVPIFDTAFVTYTRRRAGRSAVVGGRDHTSHRLVALGVSERAAVLTLYALAFAGALLAIGVGRFQLGTTLALVLLYAIVVLAIGIVLGHTADPTTGEDVKGTPPPLISEVAYRRRTYEILADTGLLVVAYYAAFRLRFQGPDFNVFFPPFVGSLPIVIGLQVAGLYFAGKYRQMWRGVSASELGTLARGLVLGISGSVMFVLFVFRFERFSRGVFIIDALVAWFLLVGARAVTSGIDTYLRKARVRGTRVLVYGAGRGGTLLVREVLQNPFAGYLPVGFIDDDPQKWRLRFEGIPVFGGKDLIPDLVARHNIREILVSVSDLDSSRLTELLEQCNRLGVKLRRMRFSLDEVRAPIVLRHDQQNSRGA